jgi:hypothetical protein
VSIPIPINDHVAVGERICRELLLVCPDPNLPDFEGREDELRFNLAIRAIIGEAMEIIAHQQRVREIHAEKDDGTTDSVVDALRAGLSVGEETAARRLISRFAMAFNGF